VLQVRILEKRGAFKPKPRIRSKPKCASQINPIAVSCGAGNRKEISKKRHRASIIRVNEMVESRAAPGADQITPHE
jgi:hypothetical protein